MPIARRFPIHYKLINYAHLHYIALSLSCYGYQPLIIAMHCIALYCITMHCCGFHVCTVIDTYHAFADSTSYAFRI